MTTAISTFLILYLLLSIGSVSQTQKSTDLAIQKQSMDVSQNPSEKVDVYVKQQMDEKHIPGLSLAVVRNGTIIFAKGYGMANMELSVPATVKTNYPILSITKTFTATAIMMLVEENKISLEDPISKHLDSVSPAGKSVTIRQLLSHTSGIMDYGDRPYVAGEELYDGTLQDYKKWVASFPLVSSPGERWDYIGVGFFLLGRLIEKISGKTYEEFMRQRIFIPLRMNDTRIDNLGELIPNRSGGYSWQNGVYRNNPGKKLAAFIAGGGITTTVVDMAKWDAALYTDKLLKRSTWEQMWTNAKLNNGQIVNGSGLGFGLTPFRGHKRVGHTGGGSGYSTGMSRFVNEKLTVILLTNINHPDFNVREMTNEIASFYFNK